MMTRDESSRPSMVATDHADNRPSRPNANNNPAASTTTSSKVSSRRAPTRAITEGNGSGHRKARHESPVSPTTLPLAAAAVPGAPSRSNPSSSSGASNVSLRERRPSLANHRRVLAVLETPNNMLPAPPAPSTNINTNTITNSGPSLGSNLQTTFYNDSSDNLSTASQLSPSPGSLVRAPNLRADTAPGNLHSPDALTFDDERRPSVASINTASSQGSKTSGNRGGGFKKLQGFFGEDLPGEAGKSRSRSDSRSRFNRDRNFSNATDTTRDATRDASPCSRPRTPVPDKEVVPFLYQEADDIARFGEAPVREELSGPDRDRFVIEGAAPLPPKTSSSSRSAYAGLSGHNHRHNKSNDESRAGTLPTISREDTGLSMQRERGGSGAMLNIRSRAHSPAPSARSVQTVGGDGQPSPPAKKGIFGRFRRFRDRDDGPTRLRDLPGSSKTLISGLVSNRSHTDISRHDTSSSTTSQLPGEAAPAAEPKGTVHRGTTFNNKFLFSRRPRLHKAPNYEDDRIGPLDPKDGTVYHLDTDLNDMEGILTKPAPLPPLDPSWITTIDPDRIDAVSTAANATQALNAANAAKSTNAANVANTSNAPSNAPNATDALDTLNTLNAGPGAPGAVANPALGVGSWNAPDSWAVQRATEESMHPELDAEDLSPKPEEKQVLHAIRIFKSDLTVNTLRFPLKATVADVISQLIRKTYVMDNLENYHIVLKRGDLFRVLSPAERPLMLQKRMLQQIGYEERDRIEEVGRHDNTYVCRFMYLTNLEADRLAASKDIPLGRAHVDLSRRNLATIPISLYSRAADILSLNLSCNLSLDLPRDFIQSCLNLREIRFTNNEAHKLPQSLGRAAKLTILDVSNNRLEQLEHAELQSLTGLLKLSLASNRLKHLPPYFGAFKSLRSLNVSSNFLDKMPTFLCELETLVDLDLSFNCITHLPDDIGRLRNLEKLVMTNNQLKVEFPASFKNLASLRELHVKYNSISSLDAVCELPKLEILSAERNQISHFRGAFERLQRLKMNSNPVTKFELVRPVPTLKVLNLSEAQLASLDGSWANMPNLERLILDRNYFVSLPPQVGSLSRLEYFSMVKNQLGDLPVEIGCLGELRELNVRRNNIRKLPMEIWWASKLETLNASSNLIDHFPKPASRPPRAPAMPATTPSEAAADGSPSPALGTTSSTHLGFGGGGISEDGAGGGGPGAGPTSRRPSNSSGTLLSVGPSPVPGDRKSSVVSVYGKGGRKTSVVSRSTSQSTMVMAPPTARKDSAVSSRLTQTFAGSLRNLYLADCKLDDDVLEQISLLGELRLLNLSCNSISDMPQRSLKAWPQLVELYMSLNDLTTFPADDLEDNSLLQVLHINGNKFTNLPADIARAKKLAVLDCGSNNLRYNIANVRWDWNWNLNPNLRYLNLSGNKRLEIKQQHLSGVPLIPGGGIGGMGGMGGMGGPGGIVPRALLHDRMREREREHDQYSDFSRLHNLRVLGLMDVTMPQPKIPDQSEDRRVRTSGSLAGHLLYGMADTLGRNEHLSTEDLVVPRFNSSETEMLLGLFDGQALSSGGSKIAKFLHENFGTIFASELEQLKPSLDETPKDALRRAFLTLNKNLIAQASQQTEERGVSPPQGPGGAASSIVLTREDLASGGVATVVYLKNTDLYVANVGDVQALLIKSDGQSKTLTHRHVPAEHPERQRIHDAGGWVSRNGRLNDVLDVSRAFGYADLMPAVLAAPHTTHVSIRENDNYETILMATKELWRYLTLDLVVDVARAERGDLIRASQKLRDLAIASGATGKIMVMMISVMDLQRRVERTRLQRGQSMSIYPSGVPDEARLLPTSRRARKPRNDVLDKTLQRLGDEIAAPTGDVAIVFTDIKNSTSLWETCESTLMRTAIKLHNEVMRRHLVIIGGYEVKTEGDAFMVSFPSAPAALLWCFTVQMQLLEVPWPVEIVQSKHCRKVCDDDGKVIFDGLSVRMGIHWGDCFSERDPVTDRMDYFGPMVNKASRISSVADGGQITVSGDFLGEIASRLSEFYEHERIGRNGGGGGGGEDGGGVDGGDGGGGVGGGLSSSSEEAFEDEALMTSIRRDLRSLSSQGFEIKVLGERKLKGLENPEPVYALYPRELLGRYEAHREHERLTTGNTDESAARNAAGGAGFAGSASAATGSGVDGDVEHAIDAAAMPVSLAPGVELPFSLDVIWSLWRISLRLEMLCSALEAESGSLLKPPETEMLDRMRQRGGEVTDRYLISFLTHQVSRIENCVSALTIRHLATGRAKIRSLDDLRGPIGDILGAVAGQMTELQRYKDVYGKLSWPFHPGQ